MSEFGRWKRAGRLLVMFLSVGLALSGCRESESPGSSPSSESSPPEKEVIPPSKPDVTTVSPLIPSPPHQSGCTLENIRPVVRTRTAEVTECYRAAAQKDPSVRGRIQLELGINPGGALVGRRVFKSELPLEVNACIVEALKGLQFPGEFTQACVIIYPFVFSAGPPM